MMMIKRDQFCEQFRVFLSFFFFHFFALKKRDKETNIINSIL